MENCLDDILERIAVDHANATLKSDNYYELTTAQLKMMLTEAFYAGKTILLNEMLENKS